MCALQDLLEDIIGHQVQWHGVKGLLNDYEFDTAVLHLLRAITALQLLTDSDNYRPFLNTPDDGRCVKQTAEQNMTVHSCCTG